MTYDPAKHHRRSIRLPGYDYSQAGAYFLTICTKKWRHLFGEIVNGKMQLNDAGRIAWQCWNEIPSHFPHAELDEFVIMPNHIHGIIVLSTIVEAVETKCLPPRSRPSSSSLPHGTSKTIGSIVRGFKIGVTKWMRCNTEVADTWHRNYWEHIIRNETELQRIRRYIQNNPAKWEKDRFQLPSQGAKPSSEIHEPMSEYGTEVWMI